MNAAIQYIPSTPLTLKAAGNIVDHIFGQVAGDATPLSAVVNNDVREIAASELVGLSSAVNWRGLVAQGMSIPAIITLLMTLLPVFIKNTTVLDFIRTLLDQFLPLFS